MIDLPVPLTASVLAACLVLLLAISAVLYRCARGAGLGRRSATLLAGAAGLAQAGWLAATAALASTGLYAAELDETIPWIGLGLGIPLVLGILALRLPPVAASLSHVHAPALLAAVQAFRIEGGVFLVLLATDRLPAGFALPAGIGDVLVGLLAPFVAYALWKRPQRRSLGVAFNALGLADLLVAITAGLLLAPGPLQAIVTEPTTEIMSALPMVLIPTFAVPLAIVLHVASFRLLVAPAARPAASSHGDQAGPSPGTGRSATSHGGVDLDQS
ncbi:MAG: hypothetical protein ACRDRZ_06140 [Pseudonocardiaceae bacterium]